MRSWAWKDAKAKAVLVSHVQEEYPKQILQFMKDGLLVDEVRGAQGARPARASFDMYTRSALRGVSTRHCYCWWVELSGMRRGCVLHGFPSLQLLCWIYAARLGLEQLQKCLVVDKP